MCPNGYTLALKWSLFGYFGAYVYLFGYMDPQGQAKILAKIAGGGDGHDMSCTL